MKFTGPYLIFFIVTIFVFTAECKQRLYTLPTLLDQRSFFRLFCLYADRHKICAVAVEIVVFGKCSLVVAGILLMTTI